MKKFIQSFLSHSVFTEHRKFLLLVLILLMGGIFFFTGFVLLLVMHYGMPSHIDFPVHSSLLADYQPDEEDVTIAAVSIEIIKEMLADTFRGDSPEELAAYYDHVVDQLKTPVPSVTAAGNLQASEPMDTPSPAPTDEVSPTATETAAGTATPERSATLTTTTVTLSPTATLTGEFTPNVTKTGTLEATTTLLATVTPTATPTQTLTITRTPTATRTLTVTPTSTVIISPTATRTATLTSEPVLDSSLTITVEILNQETCGEIDVAITITNTGIYTAAENVDVRVTISRGSQYLESSSTINYSYGNIAPGASATQHFYYTLKPDLTSVGEVVITGRISNEDSWPTENQGKTGTGSMTISESCLNN